MHGAVERIPYSCHVEGAGVVSLGFPASWSHCDGSAKAGHGLGARICIESSDLKRPRKLRNSICHGRILYFKLRAGGAVPLVALEWLPGVQNTVGCQKKLGGVTAL